MFTLLSGLRAFYVEEREFLIRAAWSAVIVAVFASTVQVAF